MPTTTLLATAGGFYSEWGAGVGSSPYVDTDDADTSYRARQDVDGAGVKRHSFTFQDLPPQASRIISVVLTSKVRYCDIATGSTGHTYGGNEPANFVRVGGVDTDGAAFNGRVGTYTTYADTFTSTLDTPAKVNAAEYGVMLDTPSAGNELRCTYLPLVVEWAPPAGAQLLHLLLPAVGALLGAGLQLSHMRGIAHELRRRTPHHLLEHELVEVFNALRAWPRALVG